MKKSAVKKERRKPARFNILVLTEEEHAIYRELKILAAKEGVYLKTIVLEAVKARLGWKRTDAPRS
jgi:hypothetical protein